ncbi:MAG: hypothetical protein MI975_17130, partial [Cytophagales bacterium]|nr:hypothetical protein [Cytophagales bacterium]
MVRVFLIFQIFFTFFFSISKATHLRAGEIVVKKKSPGNNRFTIIVILYSDRKSDTKPGYGTLDLGDGAIIPDLAAASTKQVVLLDNHIVKNVFSIDHTFAGAHSSYTIGYLELNRNPNIINMPNSANTPFYIETTVLVETPCGINNTPSLLIPPIDYAAAGKLFVHNPGAYDEEGDSISYKLVVPRLSLAQEVAEYYFPENLVLDSASGKIYWETPKIIGEYNIAFEIIERRIVGDSSVIISRMTRDMQIIVVDNLSNPPKITVPPDTCLVAGDYISATVSAFDTDYVKLEAFSNTFLYEDS